MREISVPDVTLAESKEWSQQYAIELSGVFIFQNMALSFIQFTSIEFFLPVTIVIIPDVLVTNLITKL